MRNRRWIGVLILGVLVVLGICGSTLYRQQTAVLLRGIEPSCTVGITSASITIQAWSANDDCQAMLAGPDNFTGVDWTKFGTSLVSTTSGSVACEMDMAGRHVTVRDGGMMNAGAEVCTLLQGPSLP